MSIQNPEKDGPFLMWVITALFNSYFAFHGSAFCAGLAIFAVGGMIVTWKESE